MLTKGRVISMKQKSGRIWAVILSVMIMAVSVCSFETAFASGESYIILDDFESGSLKGYSGGDLTSYGLKIPVFSLNKSGCSGNGIFSVMQSNNQWCEVLHCKNSELIKRFQNNYGNYQYLMFYVCGVDGLTLDLTVSLRDNQKRLYLYTTDTQLYNISGTGVQAAAGNASGAGANTSVAIPAGFRGWAVYKLDKSAIDFDVANIVLDVRIKGALKEDRYGFDTMCLTNDPAKVMALPNDGGKAFGDNTNIPDIPENMDKTEAAEYMFSNLLTQKPEVVYTPEYDPSGYDNIHAFYFNSVAQGGRATRAFGYIGFPAGASSGSPVPAVVLIHGSGGHPFAQWIKLWNDRGYAAIAVDHGAYMPDGKGSWVIDDKGGPAEDWLSSGAAPLDRQWMYHALAKNILANNILRADDRVIKDKIGVTGISAGGYITANIVGYDTRFAFAVPVYGFGFMHETLSDRKNRYDADTYALWEGSLRFDRAKMPIMILNSDMDFTASVDTSSKSFDNLKNAQLCIKHAMPHGHNEGWSPQEIYRFADSVVKGGGGLSKFVSQPATYLDKSFKLNIAVPSDASGVTATLYYTTEALSYNAENKLEQEWRTVDCAYKDGEVTVNVPDDAQVYYISLSTKVGAQSYISSSRLVDFAIEDDKSTSDTSEAALALVGAAAAAGLTAVLKKRKNKAII